MSKCRTSRQLSFLVLFACSLAACVGPSSQHDEMVKHHQTMSPLLSRHHMSQEYASESDAAPPATGHEFVDALPADSTLRVGDNTLFLLNNVNYPPEGFTADLILSDVSGLGAGQIGIARASGDDFSAIRLGIGLGDPQHELHLHNGPLAPFAYTAEPVSIALTNAVTGKSATDGLTMQVNTDGSARINQQESLPLTVATGGVDRLTIDSSGRIGVGTDSPQAALHVSGSPGADGVMFPDGTLQTTAAVPFALSSYDSGWFSVSTNNDYLLSHGLNSTAVIGSIWFSKSSDGLNRCYGPMPLSWREHNPEKTDGVCIAELNASTATVRTGNRFMVPSSLLKKACFDLASCGQCPSTGC